MLHIHGALRADEGSNSARPRRQSIMVVGIEHVGLTPLSSMAHHLLPHPHLVLPLMGSGQCSSCRQCLSKWSSLILHYYLLVDTTALMRLLILMHVGQTFGRLYIQIGKGVAIGHSLAIRPLVQLG